MAEFMIFGGLILFLSLTLVFSHNLLWQKTQQQLLRWIQQYETRPIKNF